VKSCLVDRVRLARLEGRDGRRAVLLQLEERQLAECIAGAVHRHGDGVTRACLDAGR